jgi:hypothetical protein
MKTRLSYIAAVASAVTMLAGCGTAQPSSQHLRSVALITSGDVVVYAAPGPSNIGVSIIEIDGRPVSEPYGPIELMPGIHTVMLKCDETVKALTRTFAGGEVYQFNRATTPGVKGCIGTLSILRAFNP